MRQFKAEGGEPSGEWWSDRKWPEETEFSSPNYDEKEKLITTVAGMITEALREHRVRDIEIKAEAIERAIGHRDMKAVTEYLGLIEDDFDEFREPFHEDNLKHDFEVPEAMHWPVEPMHSLCVQCA